MNLISILIALAVEHFYRPIHDMRHYEWFGRFSESVYNKLAGQSWRDGPIGVMLVIGSVVLGVWLVEAMLEGVTGFFGFLFGIAVLVFTLGPQDLEKQVEDVTNALSRGDMEASELHAEKILGYQPDMTPAELKQKVQEGILLEANNRVFGILLWFMLLGPVGAVLFRLSCELRQQQSNLETGFAAAARDLHRILFWLPARLLVIGFALAGSFVDTVSRWSSFNEMWKVDSETLLIESGLGAICHEPVEDENGNLDVDGIMQIMALIKRTLLVWLTALALLTLTGWVF